MGVDSGMKPRRTRDPFCHPQKVDRENLWVGLLARKVTIAVRSSAASTFPGLRRVVLSKPHALAHSGGTAPDLHRSSLLCPNGHPKQTVILPHGDVLAAWLQVHVPGPVPIFDATASIATSCPRAWQLTVSRKSLEAFASTIRHDCRGGPLYGIDDIRL
jgi:hypothetical protein